MILESSGEAWIKGQDDVMQIGPGMTMVFPPDVPHWLRNTGDTPVKTCGIHGSPHRIGHYPSPVIWGSPSPLPSNPAALPASPFDTDGVEVRRILSHTAGLSIPGCQGVAPGQRVQPLEESLASAADAAGGAAGAACRVGGADERRSGPGTAPRRVLSPVPPARGGGTGRVPGARPPLIATTTSRNRPVRWLCVARRFWVCSRARTAARAVAPRRMRASPTDLCAGPRLA
jgi:hypothetical protein